MKVNSWLAAAQHELELANITTARLDALVLLEDASGVNRVHLLAEPDMEIPAATQNVLSKLVKRRKNHEPLAYLRGKNEFYGREFIVSAAVLVPRPESEAMIELLKRYVQLSDLNSTVCIADVGTGSGALGITAQLELPAASVELLELDADAIKIAEMNVIKFTSGISVLKADLLDGSSQNYNVLLCNLPYVPDDYQINQAATHEPQIALFGGPDGLDLYRKLFTQIKSLQVKPLLILSESLPSQHEALKQLAEQYGYYQDTVEDFIQAFKQI